MQLQEFGGRHGVRDPNLLDSALFRPLNRYHYEGVTYVVELAATYCDAITRNHPFFDGNKRTAFHACLVFLRLNGLRCVASQPQAAAAVLQLTEDPANREWFLVWLHASTTPEKPG